MNIMMLTEAHKMTASLPMGIKLKEWAVDLQSPACSAYGEAEQRCAALPRGRRQRREERLGGLELLRDGGLTFFLSIHSIDPIHPNTSTRMASFAFHNNNNDFFSAFSGFDQAFNGFGQASSSSR